MDKLTRAIAILDDLVAIPSVPGARNAEVMAHVAALLDRHGARVSSVASPIAGDHGLVASIGPDVAGGLALSGHLDVVSVAGQAWSGDPFVMRRDGGRLIGRGTVDMKGFVACALAEMTSRDASSLERPIHLFLSADEETTCRSVETLVAHAAEHLPPMRGVVVGEPTGMRPADQHKGAASFLVEVTGRPIHASMADQGISAVTLAAQLILWLDQQMAANAAAATPGPYVPNFSTHTAGTIMGGTNSNTVAETCRFQWDTRLMPGDDLDALVTAFEAQVQNLTYCGRTIRDEVTVRLTSEAFFPALLPTQQDRFRAEVLSATGADAAFAVPFGTEAGIIQNAGFDVIVCGPGDASVAHLADEFIEVEQMQRCLEALSLV